MRRTRRSSSPRVANRRIWAHAMPIFSAYSPLQEEVHELACFSFIEKSLTRSARHEAQSELTPDVKESVRSDGRSRNVDRNNGQRHPPLISLNTPTQITIQ